MGTRMSVRFKGRAWFMRPWKIQALKEFEAVKATASSCETHLPVLADALFDSIKSG